MSLAWARSYGSCEVRALLPAVQAEWAVTEAAAADLDTELPFPLAGLIAAAHAASQS